MTKIRTAIILAAGHGTKFWPYNIVRQKAAFPIANVPLIRRLVDDLVAIGVDRIVVVTGINEPSVRAALRGAPVDPRFVLQAAPQGTAYATLLGAEDLTEDFLVIYGDLATARRNLRALKAAFEREQPLAAALVDPLGKEDPRDWLVAFVEGETLTGVEGHSRGGSYRLGGVYAMRPEALVYLRDNPGIMSHVPVGGMPPMEAELAQSLQMMIDEGQKLLAVCTEGYHVDLDKPWHILEANEAVLRAMSAELTESVIPASARIHDGAEIHGRLVLGEKTEIGNRVLIKGDLWLGANSTVTNGAILEGITAVGRETHLTNYCQIGPSTSLGPLGIYNHAAEYTGVALERVYCYHYSEIWGVSGIATDFGAATVCGNLRFDDGPTPWRVNGRQEIPRHASNAAYFGDFCRTGVNTIIMPGRRIGVYSCVGPGVIAYEDVPDRQLVLAEQKLTTRPWGPEKYGW
jgi:UDP-N-acetylglucosamine diphosphorylase / glucose-1-phosphate thymidylyltransferase / UDP-N-acetylgalactosamine diphosphorylase / glucosamine-1-phosphate N-acetyltransferase / galactosamine-1-phosphate N-acetyltransferase